MSPHLATVMVTAHTTADPGSVLVTVRDQQIRVDAPSQLGGPNQAPNPTELLLAALGTSAIFVCQACAREQQIPLDTIRSTILCDFDPRGVQGEPVEPYLQTLRLHISLAGPNHEEARVLEAALKARCPIYNTLARTGPVELEVTVIRSGMGYQT